MTVSMLSNSNSKNQTCFSPVPNFFSAFSFSLSSSYSIEQQTQEQSLDNPRAPQAHCGQRADSWPQAVPQCTGRSLQGTGPPSHCVFCSQTRSERQKTSSSIPWWHLKQTAVDMFATHTAHVKQTTVDMFAKHTAHLKQITVDLLATHTAHLKQIIMVMLATHTAHLKWWWVDA